MRMNIHQAAKAVGVARSTLYRDIQDGKVSVGKDGRGKPYVDVSERERAWTGKRDTPGHVRDCPKRTKRYTAKRQKRQCATRRV